MSGGSVDEAAESMTSRGDHETEPVDIGVASGVPFQYVIPDQVGVFEVVSALKA